MLRAAKIAALVVVIVSVSVVTLALDYEHVVFKEKRVLGIASQLGGRCGSIPMWPLGTEYRISFPRPLTRAELTKLKELNTLRGSVYVAFEGELTAAQLEEGMSTLPECKLYVSRDGRLEKFQVAREKLLVPRAE